MPHSLCLVPSTEPERQINYRAASAELRAAWFAYQATPGANSSLVAFAAGFNAALASASVPSAQAPEALSFPAPIAFEVGKTYRMRSTGDYDCVWDCTVTARTKKQVTLSIPGENGPIRRGITIWNGVERCAPFGRYSMAPQISADREAKL